MRCFYCARTGEPTSVEHIPSAFLGGRLTTRRVGKPCNERANREIDDPIAKYLMVQMPRALAGVRNVRAQGNEPVVEVDALVSTTAEPVKLRCSPWGLEARNRDGEIVHEVVEVRYGLASDLWVQFMAKVALGCAAKLFPDEWLDDPIAVGLRSLLWHGPIDTAVWASVPGWPCELEPENPVRQALGDDRHLVGLISSTMGSAVAVAIMFGGQIVCQLPLPGVHVAGSGRVWVLNWHPASPPPQEDFDEAIERMLSERAGAGGVLGGGLSDTVT